MDIAMNIDPNIVYLLVAAALFFTVLAIFNPGTGLLEILAVLLLFASGWGIFTLVERNLINWWSLLIILVGMVLLVVAFAGWVYILASSGWAFVLGGVGLLVLGVLAYLGFARHRREWPFAPEAGA